MLKSVYIFLILCARTNCQDKLPEVNTPLGRVRGFWKTSEGNRKYAAFEGVPYAQPPVGNLRFEEPQPVTAWTGIWNATDALTCMHGQFFVPNDGHGIRGYEDCLYLNVYVPAEYLGKSEKLDVIMTIHGGGFMIGSGHVATGERVMLDKDFVVASINYRLGILGFLSTEDDAIPGNNGLKDQVMALRWIKDNIASFGGNPHSVTIAGVSAGGASVHLHYLSPLSRGLFARGLSHSGTALSPWVVRKNALQRAKKLAVLVGCPDDSTEDMKKCLKQRPAKHLLGQLKHFYGFEILPFSPFTLVIEKKSDKAFLDEEPYQLLKEGKVFDVPWMVSFTTDDGLLPSALLWSHLDKVEGKWEQASPYILDFNETIATSKREEVPKKVLDFYLEPGEKINKGNFKKFTKMLTDRLFGISSEVAAKMQCNVTKSPVYFYVFNYDKGEVKMANFYSGSQEVEGVAHGDDAVYLYGLLHPKPYTGQDKALKNIFQDMLYSFVTINNPSFGGTNIWQPTTSEELTYLNVTGPDNFQLNKTEMLTPIQFWSKLGLMEDEHLIKN